MSYDRRKFLQLAGGLASGVAFANISCNSSSSPKAGELKDTTTTTPTVARNEPKSLDTFGVQLWTVRDDLAKDPKGVLKQLAGFGYKQIESFEGKQGMFWGMSNTDFKKYMDELGIVIVSSHCDTVKGFDKKAGDAAAIGMKYLITPWVGPQKTLDDYKKRADEFNKAGEICKKAGIRFAYHNHWYSFTQQDGQFPQDIFMANTDPSLVDYEMDIYWVVTAGQDPIPWLKKYPDRFRLCHIKDRKKDAPAKEQDASCDLGAGSIDFPKILHEALGMQYYILEQEGYDNTTPIQCTEVDATYLKNLKI